jgi:outer membrane protein W
VVFAQDDDLLANTDEVLNSEQIDIDGTFERRESAADRIAKLRKRLERQNEEMMNKKIENERIKSEKKLEKKLRKAFTGQRSDTVTVRQAAPQKVVAPAPVAAPVKAKRTAVIPSLGVSQTLSDTGNAESKIDFGLNVEHAVHNNISVGFGVGYSKMELEDPYSDFFGNQFIGLAPAAPAEGEEGKDYDYSYSRINVNLNSKFYFTGIDAKFRPYVGAGLGYNRVTIKDTNPNDDCNTQFGGGFGCNIGGGFGFQNPNQDTELSDSQVSATAMIGTNILFNDFIGMNINFSYTKFLNDAFSDQEEDEFLRTFNSNEDKIRGVGKSISEDDVAGVSAGVVIKF